MQFTAPTLADGRDLLYEIIAKANNNPKAKKSLEENKKGHSDNDDDRCEFEVGEWRPSMNLFELI